MNKQKAIAIAGNYFPNYPSVHVFHITRDGQAFEHASLADNHARTLGKNDQEVFPVRRSELDATLENGEAVPVIVETANTPAESDTASGANGNDNGGNPPTDDVTKGDSPGAITDNEAGKAAPQPAAKKAAAKKDAAKKDATKKAPAKAAAKKATGKE